MDMFPEFMSELRREEINKELKFIRLSEEAVKGNTLLDKSLAAIGKWMVARGENLRQRHLNSSEELTLDLSRKVA